MYLLYKKVEVLVKKVIRYMDYRKFYNNIEDAVLKFFNTASLYFSFTL